MCAFAFVFIKENTELPYFSKLLQRWADPSKIGMKLDGVTTMFRKKQQLLFKNIFQG